MNEAENAGRPPPRRSQALTLVELMLLIAGVAFGIWIVLKDLKKFDPQHETKMGISIMALVGVLGGVSLVGPPLLMLELLRRRVVWGPGKLLWFSQGMASWLLWPPVVYSRLRDQKFGDTMSGVCYFYGTPLMAIYVTSALLAGGWMRGYRRRSRRRSWREQFGLVLGLLWACTGFYILYILYRADFGQ